MSLDKSHMNLRRNEAVQRILREAANQFSGGSGPAPDKGDLQTLHEAYGLPRLTQRVQTEQRFRVFRPAEQYRNGTETGLWFYVCTFGDLSFPVGGCAQTVACPQCKGKSNAAWRVFSGELSPLQAQKAFDLTPCAACDNLGFVPNPEACEGHYSADDAKAHFVNFLIGAVHLSEMDVIAPCAVCQKPSKFAMIAPYGAIRVMCREHANRNHFADQMAELPDFYLP